jgi:uncharacterized protein YpuA (DUF1002 family)
VVPAGLAQAHNAQWKEAEKSLSNAIVVLESRITNLGKIEKSENITKEIDDLEALVTEIKEKIADHKTMETETIKVSKDPASMFSFLYRLQSPSPGSAEANVGHPDTLAAL